MGGREDGGGAVMGARGEGGARGTFISARRAESCDSAELSCSLSASVCEWSVVSGADEGAVRTRVAATSCAS